MITKRSCKVTFDANSQTIKVRFKNEYNSVCDVKVYDSGTNGNQSHTEQINWMAYGVLPNGSQAKLPTTLHAHKTIMGTINHKQIGGKHYKAFLTN